MAHTIRDKKKLLHRIRRIRGQVDAIQRALEKQKDCSSILQTIAACRGAMNGLMMELLEGHIELHVIDPNRKPTVKQHEAAEELIRVLRSYLK